MKVLMLNGSCKANGNTYQVLEEAGRQLKAEGIDYEIFQSLPRPGARLHRLRQVHG